MTALKKVESHHDVVDYFRGLQLYNKHFEKPKIKCLKTLICFLNVIKTNYVFRGYAISYKVEIIEKKDLIKQLEAGKSSSKDLFNDLLNETKGFKYQITLKVILKNTNQMDQFILN